MSDAPADKSQSNDREAEARALWGDTAPWAEYERRWTGRPDADKAEAGARLMELFSPFQAMRAEGEDPACDAAQRQVAAIQSFISAHYYTCMDEILAGLGQAYGAGGDFTRSIDAAAGPGTAAFAAAAIREYCARR